MDPRPGTLPVFPLAGVLLLPGGTLPLHIFEPRYVAMTEDALKGNRLIGMIQPTGETLPCGSPAMAHIGCAGQISEATPTGDGRYFITLTGLSRFAVAEEVAGLRGYRQIHPDWTPFSGDADEPLPEFDRPRLFSALRQYLATQGLNCEWQAAEQCCPARLVTTLAMVCPFTPAEKQALLEAPDGTARAAMLIALLEFEATPCPKGPLN